jgi:hypothetical protein
MIAPDHRRFSRRQNRRCDSLQRRRFAPQSAQRARGLDFAKESLIDLQSLFAGKTI